MLWLTIVGSVGMIASAILPWYDIELQFDLFIANEFLVGGLGLICLIITLVGKGKRAFQIAGLVSSVLAFIYALLILFSDHSFPFAVGTYVGLIFSLITIGGFALRLKESQTA